MPFQWEPRIPSTKELEIIPATRILYGFGSAKGCPQVFKMAVGNHHCEVGICNWNVLSTCLGLLPPVTVVGTATKDFATFVCLCWLSFIHVYRCLQKTANQNYVILSRLYFATHPLDGWFLPPLLTIGPLRGAWGLELPHGMQRRRWLKRRARWVWTLDMLDKHCGTKENGHGLLRIARVWRSMVLTWALPTIRKTLWYWCLWQSPTFLFIYFNEIAWCLPVGTWFGRHVGRNKIGKMRLERITPLGSRLNFLP